MKCRRAFDADLLAVVREEGGEADFLAHYPTCPDCAAEVGIWGELDGMLRTGASPADPHPEPATLLTFTDAPATLGAVARGDIERHLASCRACADEVRSLGGFDPVRLGVATPSPVSLAPSRTAAPSPTTAAPTPAAASGRPDTADASPRGFWLGRLVWHPAFAYALVAVLAVPLLRGQLPQLTEKTRAVDARRDAPLLPPASEGGASQPLPPVAAKRARPPEALADADRVVAAPLPAPPPAQAPAAPRAETAFAKRRAAPEERQAAPEEKEARSADAGSDRIAPGSSGGAVGAREQAGKEDDEHFGNLLGATGAPAAAARAGGHDARSVLRIRPLKPTIVSATAVAPGIVLQIEPPADLAPGPLDVKVQSRAGRHELGARIADRANAIAIEIPPHWLLPDDYVVTLQPVGGGPPARLGFTVSAPIAER